ncbi:beta-ketoacyl synthase N-terminal-like domain-containing protein [Candidatus Viridilinea mediisalina]
MASIFPEARTLDEFWDNIVQARDCLIDVPPSRWNIADHYDPDPAAPDKTYCKRGGFIPDIDFDPVEFGLPPNILEVTDVSQLLSLVVARQTFEDAGYGAQGRPFDRERTGVVLGVGGGQKLITPLTARLQYPVWERVLKSCGLSDAETAVVVEKLKSAYVRWEENSFPGMLGNVIAGRIANRFDLGGINCVVDAACAASLAALKLALSELTERRCDMLLTGGVDTDNSIFMYLSFSKTPAFSSSDAPRPFDVDSDGMMVGEGVGMVLLKRLEDAERDGDRIYAVIRGIGTSSDGRAKSIYAPRSEGQARALRRAHADAAVEPSSVGLIEAHGTGTVAGDLCEATTLSQVFSAAGVGRASVALGSVKSQIGHTKAAAGVAGLIKAALALHHKVLPPTINIAQPNPKLGIEQSPLYLNTETRPWLRGATPRRAGVSAFGFGGTNFHVLLEEASADHTGPYRRHTAPRSLLLRASTPEVLRAQCADLAATLVGDGAASAFAELCRQSAADAPAEDEARLGFVATSVEEVRQLLQLATESLAAQPEAEAWTHPRGIFYRRRGMPTGTKVVALFAGQGAQHLNMGRELALNFPELRTWFERMDTLFTRDNHVALSRIVFPPPVFDDAERERQAEALQQTEYAQPAIGALSAAMYELFRSAGFQPDMVAGHSFGELTALWAAGVVSDEDFAALARARGHAMRPPADPSFDAGTMLAIAARSSVAEEVVAQVPGLTIANHNAPEQIVLAGSRTAVAAAANVLASRSITAKALPVSAAFHTPLVGHAQVPFAQAINGVEMRPPQVPIYANSTAAPYPTAPEAIKQQLADQLLRPVQFQQQIERIYADGGAIFVEFGPRNILTGLVRQTLGARPHLTIALGAAKGRDSDRQMREGLIQLRVAGLPLGQLDAYRYEQAEVAPRRRGMTVRINGANYVSERTRAAHQAALDDGFRITRELAAPSEPQKRVEDPMPELKPALSPVAPSAPAPVAVAPAAPVAVAPAPVAVAPAAPAPVAVAPAAPAPVAVAPAAPAPVAVAPAAPAAPRASAPVAVAQPAVQPSDLYSIQRETLQMHQRYLQQQAEYTQSIMQLLQAQQRLVGSNGSQINPAQLTQLEQALTALHTHQSETLRLHERYLTEQHARSERLVEEVGNRKQEVGSRKQEAKLGDVVQRIGNGHGNGHSAAKLPMAVTPSPVAPPPMTFAPVAPAPAPLAAAPASSPLAASPLLAQAEAVLLDVVTELTGYPRETLELEMDMEGDLGIDSIKRVQILGAMQERMPDLPSFKPEHLAELSTLGQVLEHVRPHLLGAGATPASSPPASSPPASSPPASSPPASSPLASPPLAPPPPAPTAYAPEPAQIPGADRSVPRLLALPPPDQLECALPPGSCCLITDDGSPLAAAVAQALNARGWPAVVLRFPESIVPNPAPLPAAVSRVVLADASEAQLEQALQLVAQSYGPVAAFIHLHPRAAQPTLLDLNDTALIRHVFLTARTIGSSLQAAAEQARSCFFTVARMDGALGIGLRGDYSAIPGGLAGLTKTLRHEWPYVFCRSLDLSPELEAAHAAALIVAELHDPDRLIADVGYGAYGRVSLVGPEV